MMLKVRPSPRSDLPQLPRLPCLHAVLTTPADRTGAFRFLPHPCCLPRITGGSASTSVLLWNTVQVPLLAAPFLAGLGLAPQANCFRGLLELHSRYGLQTRSPPIADLVPRLRPGQLPSQAAR